MVQAWLKVDPLYSSRVSVWASSWRTVRPSTRRAAALMAPIEIE